MRVNIGFQARFSGVFFYNLPDAHRRHFGSAGGKENFVSGAAAHQFWSLAREVGCQRLARFAPDRHQARFTALADHPQNPVFGIEVLQPRVRQFGNAEAASVEQFDDGAIPQTQPDSCIDRLEELFDLNFVQRLRQIALDSRKGKRLGWIPSHYFLTQEKTKKNLERDYN